MDQSNLRAIFMKAIVYTKYGPPDVLQLKEVEKPIPKDSEVLIKVFAASVNYNNLLFVKGEPLVGRFFTGLLKPKFKTPGNDIAGRVEVVGSKVKQFQPGDEVFGDISECGFGAFAEYVSVPENALALKPVNISFEEAAAVPEAALVALQALCDDGQIRTRQNVLIYGASGGIGTFAVQIAKYFGVKVTGVCSTRNLDMVHSIGADHVIDYTQEDFTKNGQHYDLILATAGYRSIFDYKRALSPGGIYVVTGGSMKQIFQGMLIGPLVSMLGSKKLSSMTVKVNKDLDFMRELIETGKVKPVIDRHYSLNETAEALRYYGKGHARGKVVITLEPNNKTKPL
jgi:NADPH:quinone reductase-like Zn-dependent oxidoreductase